MLATVPLKRRGQPEDVANAVNFLASDDAAYITGHVLERQRRDVHVSNHRIFSIAGPHRGQLDLGMPRHPMRSYCVLVPFLLALPAFAAQYETAIPGATIAAITSDRFGAVYVTGSTSSTSLPVTPNAPQSFIRGVCGQSNSRPVPCTDAFVAKINPNGTFAYLTYLGGSGNDAGTSIAVDVDGSVLGGRNDCIGGLSHHRRCRATDESRAVSATSRAAMHSS